MNRTRIALLVVGVVLSGLIISNAFPTPPGHAPAAQATTSPSPSPSSSPSNSPSPAVHQLVCGSPNGVAIAVENAAGVPVLAAPTATMLKAAGYTFNSATDVSNASAISNTTTVFYRTAADKHAAACLKKKYFPAAALKPMSAGGTAAHPAFSQTTGVAVFLGKDYAANHPSH
jgi:hypothetical protein